MTYLLGLTNWSVCKICIYMFFLVHFCCYAGYLFLFIWLLCLNDWIYLFFRMLLSKSRVPRGRPRCGLDWAPRWYWRCRRRWCTLWLTSSCALDSTIATAVPAVSPSGCRSSLAVWLGSGLPQQSAPWSWSGRKCSLRGWAILVCFITIYSRISIFRISNIHT